MGRYRCQDYTNSNPQWLVDFLSHRACRARAERVQTAISETSVTDGPPLSENSLDVAQ